MNESPDIVLASASPRRHELLTQLKVKFTHVNADIDETRLQEESPEIYVERLAREKALAGWRMAGEGLPALGADTVVLLDGRILGKPASADEAARMLTELSGRQHEVLSAVAIAHDEVSVESRLNRTRVTFARMPAGWIRAYCATTEPMDKAGAYAIQGMAGRYVSRIDGSFSGVMGLPLFETGELMRRAGVPC